jgi:hypothetical protein
MEGAVTERRGAPRVCLETGRMPAARLRTGDPLLVLNIGAGGALVESRTRLLPGALIDVQLSDAEGSRSVRARVVRCSVSVLDRDRGVHYRGAIAFTQRVPVESCAPHSPR